MSKSIAELEHIVSSMETSLLSLKREIEEFKACPLEQGKPVRIENHKALSRLAEFSGTVAVDNNVVVLRIPFSRTTALEWARQIAEVKSD